LIINELTTILLFNDIVVNFFIYEFINFILFFIIFVFMKIRIINPELLFFTSDTHFGHKSIIDHTNRPFVDIKDHDESLIKNWNMVVPKNGIVVHQGDFALSLKSNKLKWILESLNYDVMYLIQGNHEKDIMKKFWAREYFENISQRMEFEVRDNNGKFKNKEYKFNVIVADHFPMLSWNRSGYGSYHTYGHTHGNLKNHPSSFAYEVGIDVNDYKPISYFDLMEKFKEKE